MAMQFIFQDQAIHLPERDPGAVRQFMEQINKALNENGLVFSHFLVSGMPYYGDIYSLVDEYWNKELPVEIVGITEEEWLSEAKREILGYVGRAAGILQELSQTLYSGESSPAVWRQMSDLSEGMEYLLKIFSKTRILSNPDPIISGIQSVSGQLVQALEARDLVLLADLITYEILPLFQQIKERLTAEEGTDVNG
ncbi:MAG: hypothetical protein C6W57_06160 [Caldibacillus debilis]|jgi:hypothetical protein|nr:hypothetical protein [Bacillaceae bacterium]MBY6272381.1 hypothetical protein [Bacillaceae bacterium]OUM88229.1 MAG: hypothetical protein BAA03_15015 [Caldibacillus debilis]REJ17153.1 MAG: hypothetical protein C6W57_06160 [Caldibacillus debilis]REJ29700.1 MAG: hypothetical protein C6W56_05530 [Caldibacillus debilis]